jgi:Holliday junction resolvase
MASMGGRYRKGSEFERTIVKAFCNRGWVAFRAAGSGKSERYLPDIVAMKSGKAILIECKATSKDRLSLKTAINALKEYAEKSGMSAYLAIRFHRQKPRFYQLEEILQKKNHTIHKTDEYQTIEVVTGEQKRL